MNYKFSIPCSTKSLQQIRDFVRKVLLENGLNSQDSNMIVLAVDEACTNVIIHGNDCDTTENLDLEITTTEEELLIKVMDTGCYQPINEEFNDSIVSEKIKNRQKGGLGLFIMNKIMDRVEFKTDHNINFCLLSKKLKPKLINT